jgi:hypothetical protein
MELDRRLSQPVAMREYAASLAREAVGVLPGSANTWWVRHEGMSLVRRPVPCLDVPPAKEVRSVLWRAGVPVASYVCQPDEQHPQNAWLYVCHKDTYSMSKLGAPVRRHLKRALRELRFDLVSPETFLEHASVAYCDTRRRAGLADGTTVVFRQLFEPFLRNPASFIIGAWKENELAAFLTVVMVDDWAELGLFSADRYLPLRPNNGLIHVALETLLAGPHCRLVSYGLSSVQEASKAEGLHAFKTRVGFEARPAHRAFVFHPLLRAFANPITLCVLRGCARLHPRSRALNKASGLLATHLGRTVFPKNEGPHDDCE